MRLLISMMLVGSLACGEAHAEVHWKLWESYANGFMDGQGRVLDHDAGDRTTSEGQAYALFFALVANDRARFDRALAWTESNLAQRDLQAHLPSWLWENKNGAWQITDRNSASDADLWLAFTLLEAGRLWHDGHLEHLGHAVAAQIESEELVDLAGFGKALLPGPSGFRTSDGFYQLNPSYLPVQVLLGLQSHIPRGPWADVAASTPRLLRGSAPGGFILDWIAFRPGDGFSIYPSPVPQPLASYDAIRVYLWAGMLDEGSPYRREVLDATSGMAHYLETHSIPPAEVTASGQIKSAAGSAGFSAAVLPLVLARNMRSAAQQQMSRLEFEKNARTGLLGDKPRYYDQNLALFAMGWYERRFRFDARGLLKVTWK